MVGHCLVKFLIFLEERVPPDAPHGDPVLGSPPQDPLDEVYSLMTQLARYDIVPPLYQSKCAWEVTAIEGKVPRQQSIQDDPAAPDISPITTVSATVDDLRGGIMGTSTRCVQPVTNGLQRGHPKVGKLDVVIRVQENVLWLQVSMADIEPMAVAKTSNYLTKQSDCFLFGERALFGDVVEKLSAVDVF